MEKKTHKVLIIITIMIMCLTACGIFSAGIPNRNNEISDLEFSTDYDYGIDYYEHMAKLTEKDLEVILEMTMDYIEENGLSAKSYEANLYCAELIKEFAAKKSETAQ